MGVFSAILDRIRGHKHADNPSTQTSSSSQTVDRGAQPQTQQTPTQKQTAAATASGTTQPVLQNVDVDAVLSELAAKKGGGGNYRQSIVDLLKLLDLDSSLAARKELAEELHVSAGAHGSAEQNIALHRAVIRKLEENGGKVPQSMRS